MVRILETWTLTPGMKTAKPVYQQEQLLLRQDTLLTPSIIQRLTARGIRRIAIYECAETFPIGLAS